MFRLQAYNPQNDVWSGRMFQVQVFHSNGAVKLGSKLYYTGGYDHDGGFDLRSLARSPMTISRTGSPGAPGSRSTGPRVSAAPSEAGCTCCPAHARA